VLTSLTSWTLAALAAVSAGPADAREDVSVRIDAVVAQALAEAEGVELGEFEWSLVELGHPAIAPLFELLVAGEVGSAPDEVALGVRGEDLVLSALERLPHAGLLQVLGGLGTAPGPEQLRAAHLALAVTGAAEDLPLLVLLSTPAEVEGSVPPGLRSSFTDATAQILARHRDEGWLVAKHYEAMPAGLRSSFLLAVERAGMNGSLELLADLLGVHSELDVLILGQLARAASPWVDSDRAVEIVRERLGSGDEREQIAAVMVLGAFEDSGSIDALINLMDGASPALVQHLDEALVRTTGREFRADPELWRAWRQEIGEWWRTDAQVLLGDLHRSDRARAAAAINELARHHGFRREFEEELLLSLDPGRPELCALGCAVLGRMGSPRAVPHLESLSGARDEWVSRAASRALEEISRRIPPRIAQPQEAKSR